MTIWQRRHEGPGPCRTRPATVIWASATGRTGCEARPWPTATVSPRQSLPATRRQRSGQGSPPVCKGRTDPQQRPAGVNQRCRNHKRPNGCTGTPPGSSHSPAHARPESNAKLTTPRRRRDDRHPPHSPPNNHRQTTIPPRNPELDNLPLRKFSDSTSATASRLNCSEYFLTITTLLSGQYNAMQVKHHQTSTKPSYVS